MTDPELYLYHRKASDAAFRAGDGAACTGQAALADAALYRFAAANAIGTDEAARRIRIRQRQSLLTLAATPLP